MEISETKLRNLVCEIFGLKDIGDFSDGFHTFNDLYHQRAVLFATIVKQNRDKAWKSWLHEDGEPCFDGDWFIVGVDTPQGSYTYHYHEEYWDMFDCLTLERAKHWDGHTDKDVERLLSLYSHCGAWHDAEGEDLPPYDKEVIALIGTLEPYYTVCFAHRPDPAGWDGKSFSTGKVEHFTPKTFGIGGWNIYGVKWWLDVELPKAEEEEQ